MRAILFEQAEITSMRPRKDRSMSFAVSTGELTPENVAAFLPIMGTNVKILVEPLDVESEPPMPVKGAKEAKSPSQRLYSVLYVFFKQLGEPGGDFQDFYNQRMEKIISDVKSKLDPF